MLRYARKHGLLRYARNNTNTMKKTVKTADAAQINDEMRESARLLFESLTNSELYFTSDGTAFTKKEHAGQHATFLDDQKITTIKREE